MFLCCSLSVAAGFRQRFMSIERGDVAETCLFGSPLLLIGIIIKNTFEKTGTERTADFFGAVSRKGVEHHDFVRNTLQRAQASFNVPLLLKSDDDSGYGDGVVHSLTVEAICSKGLRAFFLSSYTEV